MTRQNIVVLGAGGFIGRRIMEHLSMAPWADPVAASRRVSESDWDPGIRTCRVDATDRATLEQALCAADAVVSCIAGSAHDIVEGGRALIEIAAGRAVPPRIVWLGSLAAYGSASGTVAEDDPLLGDLGPYSAAKAQIDRLASRYPFVVRLRPGIVYGPESPWWSDRIARLIVGYRLGNLGPAGEGICNLVHVEDVAAAVIQALRSPIAGGEAFNLGCPDPPTWNEYFAKYARALRATPFGPVSSRRLRFELQVAGPALKIAEKLLPRSPYLAARPAIRPWLTTLCRHRIRMDVTKAERDLDMRWRPLDTGLEQAAAWFLSGHRTA